MSSPSSSSVKLLSPPKGRYSLSNLLQIPNRLIHPGALIERDFPATRPDGKFGGATAGVVRGARIKLCDVQLEDVVSGKMTPPISLKDFEDFLAFRTKSAENLYFNVWLNAYTQLYNSSTPSMRSHTDLMALGAQYRTAVETFFSTTSPLELNVSSDIRRQLDGQIQEVSYRAAANPSGENFLPPDAFAQVAHDTSESLQISFKTFIHQASRNADRNRARFAMFLGALTWALGLIPTIVCAILGKSRGYRAIGLPLWWFGVVVLVGGLKRTCLVIYFFGDNRQLYPWELAREAADSASFYSGEEWGSPITLDGSNEKQQYEDSSNKSSPNIESAERSPDLSNTHSRRSSSFQYYPLAPKSPSLSEKSVKSEVSSGRELYFVPAHVNETLPQSSKVWAPFTKILSPVVARAQQKLVLAAAGYGVVAMVITGAICLAVPNRNV